MNKEDAKTAFKDFLESRSERNWLKEYRRNRFEDLKKLGEPFSGPAESGVVKINISKAGQKSGLVALEINEALRKQPETVKKYFLKEKIRLKISVRVRTRSLQTATLFSPQEEPNEGQK